MWLGADSKFSDFLDGLGPGQLVGRQTLATPAMVYWAWKANVESAVQMEKWDGTILDINASIRVLAKKKTKIARKTLEPLYQQVLLFEESPRGKVLQTCREPPGKTSQKVLTPNDPQAQPGGAWGPWVLANPSLCDGGRNRKSRSVLCGAVSSSLLHRLCVASDKRARIDGVFDP
ncbi:hypothetical protein NHX12_022801 [Muraenolepis orangiensis]|uniref:Uncharacterized protein n=1 Tax=Muraenolepis orangiensis TaxID=630683 RepID=A0A9Q0ENX7_9TELE|nr:hypothetical protein NHX12_022801 [Muraenolepis orangiensis]